MDTLQETGHMQEVSQSRQDTDNPSVDILNPKTVSRVGCWNVRTLYQTGKIAQVIQEMDRYNLQILGICETRWTGCGERSLATGHHIIYSGRSDEHHSRGVGILTTKETKKCMIGWKPINDRIITARFHSKYTKLTIIVCYSPIEDAEEEDKDMFYDKLQETLDEIPKHDMVIVMGDLNSKVGSTNEGHEQCIGQQGCGNINNNGHRLVNFCEENNLVIGGTLFMHKNIHKLTWTSPDGNTTNQIDHIIINKRWRGSLQDVRVKRGADVNSDHFLLTSTIKLKLRKAAKKEQRNPPIDVHKLKDLTVQRAYQVEVRNKFSILNNRQELDLEQFNQILREAGNKILGPRKRKKEEWISPTTWAKIDQRKETKRKILSTKSERIKDQLKDTYKQQDKEVKRGARNDKKEYIEKLANDAETAAAKNDMRTLYQISKTLSGKYNTSANAPVKQSNGKLTSCIEEELKCWKEHFERVLNREDPSTDAVISPPTEVLDIDTNPPTPEEVKKAIASSKNGKAPGIDQVHAEMLKAENTITHEILTTILQNVWTSEAAPEAWKTGLIVKLPKKGDLTDTNNWRGITLLSITSKVLSKIILQRVSALTDSKLRPEQAGFRKGKSCTDQIFILRQIMEQSYEWNCPLYANFIDFTKTFDSVHRPALWKILAHYGIPCKIINVIKMLYTDFEAKVICGSNLTESFPIQTGVRQGCLLSPMLFNFCIDWIMTQTTARSNRGIPWTFTKTLEDLDFADDIALLSHRFQDIQGKTNDLSSYGNQLGLNINEKKTKVMRMNSTSTNNISLNNTPIEEVEEFLYLGSKVTINGDSTSDVNSRITKARSAFASLRNIWKSTSISTKTKIRIFKSNILGVLLYGAESWKVTKYITDKLDTFQTRCLRRILKIFWPNTISNNDLYTRTSTAPISQVIKERRWRWIGHVSRMDSTDIARVAMRWTPPGKRKRGRPRETWRRSVEKEMKDLGWTWGQIPKLAADRKSWRSSVKALCAFTHPED